MYFCVHVSVLFRIFVLLLVVETFRVQMRYNVEIKLCVSCSFQPEVRYTKDNCVVYGFGFGFGDMKTTK